MPETSTALLHPAYRARSVDLEFRVAGKRLPISRYEGYRPPERQAALFAFGRASGVGVPGRHKTFERAWESSHQHGMAEDWVWRVDGKWSWAPPAGRSWDEFHELATAAGLQFLHFEEPHVQLPGFSARALLEGKAGYPAGGDRTWEANLEAAAAAWGMLDRKDQYGIVQPGAPHALAVGDRPAILVPPGMVYDEDLGLCVAAPEATTSG